MLHCKHKRVLQALNYQEYIRDSADALIYTANRENTKFIVLRSNYTFIFSAAIDAFQQEFTSVSVTGCLFHLSQSIKRKAFALGYKSLYSSDPIFNLKV